jgi:GTP-binding protein
MAQIVAIVGRPNVGKSSLFNRILGRRAAVVDDVSGVTRDRHYRPATWDGLSFLLVDTGGMVTNEKESLARAIHEQIRLAIDEASAVLLVVEAGCGITKEDLAIATELRKKAADKVLLVVNKSESERVRYAIDDYRSLGLGDPFPISALHGTGVGDLLDRVVDILKDREANDGKKDETAEVELPLKIAVVGRPNAGKSSLVNKLLQKKRMIVDTIPGTTRDSIDSEMAYNGRPVLLIDTAGLRKKSHVKQDIEYYFNLRAIHSIERCDVVVVLVDTAQALGVQDLRIVAKAFELHKGILLVWNKWDLVDKDHKTFDKLVAETKRHYQELRPVPMIAISALSGQRVTGVLDKAFEIRERMTVRVPNAEFEDNVFAWSRAHPHPAIPANPVRMLGARQVEAPYPRFRIFTTNPRNVADSYVRYLTNKIYDAYHFEGCPVVLDFKKALKAKHSSTHHTKAAPGDIQENT